MILMRILPGVLKELLKHVPTVLFQVVDWNEFASELPKLSRRILQKEDYEDVFKKQLTNLALFNVNLTYESLKKNEGPISKTDAQKCLSLYFAQLFSGHGIFLDLRSHHFRACDNKLLWHPTGLWARFEESFHQGLINVYDGFYLENEDLYLKGLLQIGLISQGWNNEDKKKLGNLFKEQFGSALNEEMNFDLEHLKNSITKTTDFLLSKKVKITKDFLYLGVYLVTLYSHLEQCPEKLPVREIYLEVRKNFID